MNLPLVSVIIPCFNQGRYLAEAIDSALAQTYERVEIIIINSGSTDETAGVANRYGDRIRLLTIENDGVSRARNKGILESCGELIALLDADDHWLPEKLSYQVPRLLESPDAALVYSAYRSFTPEGRSWVTDVKDGFAPTLHDQLHFNYVNSQTAIFRRHILDVVGMFDEALHRAEDWDLWNRIAAQGAILGTSQVVAEYRRHPGTLTSDQRLMLGSKLQVLRKGRSLHANCLACDRAYRLGLREAHAVYSASLCAESSAQFQSGHLLAAARSRVVGLWHNPRSPLARLTGKREPV